MDEEYLFLEGGDQPFLAYIKDERLQGITPLFVSTVGNIYRGRIEHIEEGIPAAFVEIGLEERGFLPMKGKKSLQRGQTVLVEIKKDPRGQKGAVLTTDYSLAGHYTVYFPEGNQMLFSKKIKDNEVKESWREYQKGIPGGILLRTEGERHPQEALKELESFIVLGEKLIREKNFLPVPKLLHTRTGAEEFLLRYYKEGIPLYTNAPETAKRVAPDYQWSSTDISLGENRSLSFDLSYLRKRKVPLPGGGNIVIDVTESCTVIDVNSASANFKEDLKQKVNLEAAREIPRQIRLRNLSGIILIDFITVGEQGEEELTDCLKSEFKEDPNDVTVYGFTALHLCEIGRQRKGAPLFDGIE